MNNYIRRAEQRHFQFVRVLQKRLDATIRAEGYVSRVPLSALPPLRGRPGVTAPATTASSASLNRWMAANAIRSSADLNVQYMTSVTAQDVATQALVGALGATAENIALFIAATGEAASRKQGMARIHQEIAQKAQDAVVNAYESRFANTNQYRRGQNRETGKLGPALRAPGFTLATRDGIFLINKTFLDEHAKHWYRLNFGAQPEGRYSKPKSFEVKFGEATTSISLRQFPPSERFFIPKGFWISGRNEVESPDGDRSRTKQVRGRTGDQFYTPMWFHQLAKGPQGKGAEGKRLGQSLMAMSAANSKSMKKKYGRTPFMQKTLTKGIRGAHFFDAGMQVLATELPVAYDNLMTIWTDEARKGKGPIAKVIAKS